MLGILFAAYWRWARPEIENHTRRVKIQEVVTAAIDEGEQRLAQRGIAPADAKKKRPDCKLTPRCKDLWAKAFNVTPEAAVTVALARDVDGRRLTVSPTIEGGKVVRWLCSSDVEQQRWLPAACRAGKST